MFSGSENFLDKRRWNHYFLSKLFCLKVPKLFVEEPFCVPANFRYRKVFITKKVIESLLSHSTEKLRLGTLRCFTTSLVSKKFMDERRRVEGRSIAFPCIKRFVSQWRQTSEVYPSVLCFRKFLGSKNLRDIKRGVTILCRNRFDSQYRIISQGNPSVRHYLQLSKTFLLKTVMSRSLSKIFLSEI